ncbi:MAG: acyl-CoA dehydrogenase family protein [Alphaproteobacteria bacterium]|jgi:alkylation response protein AidB-like acyl-CoA dehydrogenase|nr:acyl-CoA dehydrogenase family protein [Alphaproteobacteria bacterium]MDP6812560.1 acyl-CoA dehydrogenase family protein [Alphaproteobacteria bacterium]
MTMVEFAEQLSETEQAIRETAHRFAAEVMRPVGQKLDRLTAEEVIAEGSPLYDVHRQYRELGFAAMRTSTQDLSPAEAARIRSIVANEMGWGDSGLGISLGASLFPPMVAAMVGNPELAEQFTTEQIGCWAITEPDHGSDEVDFNAAASATGADRGRPNCIARKDGNSVVINGQKSAWVSNGTIAETAALFCGYDDGSGGELGHAVFLVDLKDQGVSKGKPTDKIGQRSLNQGEIFFDEVRVPLGNMAVGPEKYLDFVDAILCMANGGMGGTFAGVAQAALDHAVAYAKERVQGGVPIFEHQSVKARLFEMFRKVEAARALNRQVVVYNSTTTRPRLELAIASKVTSTQTAFEVASEAMGIYGGAGIMRDNPVEALMRDARISMIEDGCNDILGLIAADRL